jgi:hypothetical protein
MTMPDNDRQRINETLTEIAQQVGGTIRAYPRPGEPVRRVVLHEVSNELGTQHEDAVLEADGTVRITGADCGPGVTDIFGPGITSYDWVYVIAPDRVPDLVAALGGTTADDVLALVAAYYNRVNGQISGLLRGPTVGAEFSNWHS